MLARLKLSNTLFWPEWAFVLYYALRERVCVSVITLSQFIGADKISPRLTIINRRHKEINSGSHKHFIIALISNYMTHTHTRVCTGERELERSSVSEKKSKQYDFINKMCADMLRRWSSILWRLFEARVRKMVMWFVSPSLSRIRLQSLLAIPFLMHFALGPFWVPVCCFGSQISNGFCNDPELQWQETNCAKRNSLHRVAIWRTYQPVLQPQS